MLVIATRPVFVVLFQVVMERLFCVTLKVGLILSFSSISFVCMEILSNVTQPEACPFFKTGPKLKLDDLIGSWMTVYTQPSAIDCFTLHVRATTDLEKEQFMIKYGNFGGLVNWNLCLLEVVSPLGKHYLQGDGSNAGLLENIIILETRAGEYSLQDQSADQWTVFGRRGSEILVMRDCSGGAAAAFARACFWPTPTELHATLHRSGIAPLTLNRVLCELSEPARQLWLSKRSHKSNKHT